MKVALGGIYVGKGKFCRKFLWCWLGLSLPSTFAHVSLPHSLSVYVFLLFLTRNDKIVFRRRPASKPVVQFETQLTSFFTWETVFLPPTHWAGPTPSPICENEKWFQMLPDIPRRVHCPCLRAIGIAHIPYVL